MPETALAARDILSARDLLTETRDLIEALYMMAADLDRHDCGPFQRVATVAKDTIKRADAMLAGDNDDEGGE